TLAGELDGGGAAHPGRGAGDDDYLVGKLGHGGSPQAGRNNQMTTAAAAAFSKTQPWSPTKCVGRDLALAIEQLLDQPLGGMADDQGILALVVLHPLAEKVSLEADRQPVGLAIELEEVVEGALVRRNLRRQAVVLVADVVVERPGVLLIQHPGQLFQRHLLALAEIGRPSCRQ